MRFSILLAVFCLTAPAWGERPAATPLQKATPPAKEATLDPAKPLDPKVAWQLSLTPGPGAFPPLRPFVAHYKFGWAMLSAAEADFTYGHTKEGPMKLTVATKSVGGTRALWRMDSQNVSLVDPVTLRPISMAQTETYKDETIQTTLTFVPEGVDRLRESKPPDKEPAKVKRFKFVPMYDLHAALHFVRSQKLANGDVYKLVVYPTTAPYLAQVSVLGREKIKVAGQTWTGIKLDLKLWKVAKSLELEAHEKFKKATVWLSDDGDRIFLRVESEIHVGKVWGEVEKIEWKP